MNDFYVGYLPKAPQDLARFVRRAVVGLFLLGVAIAGLLVFGQGRFLPAWFEWKQVRTFEGTIEEQPYPALLIRRPGITGPGDEYSRYLLVAVGKHGAGPELLGLDGRTVQLKGKLIYRPEMTVIEIMPNSVQTISEKSTKTELSGGERVTLHGEIADSKCYAGVMNPSTGKVHRDCAVRCLSGGIPPVLLTNDDGTTKIFWLAGADGKALEKAAFLDKVAEPVSVSGRIYRRGDEMIVAVDDISRLR